MLQGNRAYIEIREFQGNVSDLNALLKAGEWEIVQVHPAYHPIYILGRRPKIEEDVGEMIIGLMKTSDESEADRCVRSGKWRLLKVMNVQSSRILGGHALQDSEVVFVLGCIKP